MIACNGSMPNAATRRWARMKWTVSHRKLAPTVPRVSAPSRMRCWTLTNWPGCADEKDFTRYRALAVASGILQCKRKGTMTRDGRTPNLYAINPRFLRSHTGQVDRDAHTGQLPRSYIDG